MASLRLDVAGKELEKYLIYMLKIKVKIEEIAEK
jgi:hypothetical protein